MIERKEEYDNLEKKNALILLLALCLRFFWNTSRITIFTLTS